MRRLELRREAEVELLEASLRYDQERPGLGFRFESEVDRAITRIVENPLQFPEIYSDVAAEAGSTEERVLEP
ncbi:MAG: hypothetical protein IT372_36650 [Polyangiaceae bacterium]|nr:hypothetical protein [Polyangiaceae bacterium]